MRNGMLTVALGGSILGGVVRWRAGNSATGRFGSGERRARGAKGNWVRPEGGYMIAIKGIGPDGWLDAR